MRISEQVLEDFGGDLAGEERKIFLCTRTAFSLHSGIPRNPNSPFSAATAPLTPAAVRSLSNSSL